MFDFLFCFFLWIPTINFSFFLSFVNWVQIVYCMSWMGDTIDWISYCYLDTISYCYLVVLFRFSTSLNHWNGESVFCKCLVASFISAHKLSRCVSFRVHGLSSCDIIFFKWASVFSLTWIPSICLSFSFTWILLIWQHGVDGKNCIADEHYLPTFFNVRTNPSQCFQLFS